VSDIRSVRQGCLGGWKQTEKKEERKSVP